MIKHNIKDKNIENLLESATLDKRNVEKKNNQNRTTNQNLNIKVYYGNQKILSPPTRDDTRDYFNYSKYH